MKKLNVLIAGAGGFLGRETRNFLLSKGHAVFTLSRTAADGKQSFLVDYAKEELRIPEGLCFDAVINFCGENLAQGRWNEKRKRALLESRLQPTRCLVRRINDGALPTGTLINASGVGYYGNAAQEPTDERGAKGEGFLADLCEAWEAPVLNDLDKATRGAVLRLGVVLAPNAGFLRQITPVFKWGLGGRLGSGEQYLSWIGLEDLLHALLRLCEEPKLTGPVNFCAPFPATNKAFTREFAAHLSRPAFFAVPAFALKALLGDMAENLILAGQNVRPQKLLDGGFCFSAPDLRLFFAGTRQDSENSKK